MSIRLEIAVVAALERVPVSAVSHRAAMLLRDFARHADTKSGLIFVSLATAARELRTSRSYTRELLDALLAKDVGVLELVAPARHHQARQFRINVEALKALQRAGPERHADVCPQGAAQSGMLNGGPVPDSVPLSDSQGAAPATSGCRSGGIRVPPSPGYAVAKGESTSKGLLKENGCLKNDNRSSTHPPPSAAAFGGSGDDLSSEIRSFIDAAADETIDFDDIFARVVEQFPACANDSRIGEEIGFAIERRVGGVE